MHPPLLRALTTTALLLTAHGLLALQSLVAAAADAALADSAVVEAAGGGDGLWEVKPGANGFGVDRPSYGYTLPRGGQLRDSLVVVNRGKTPLVLSLYGADVFTTDAGRLDLRGAEVKARDVGAWVQLEQRKVRVPPGQSVDVPFRLALPDSVAPGDHLGGIVTSTADQRQVIKIRLRVSGELKPALSVDDLKVQYAGTPNPLGTGSATVTYTLRNTGNAIVSARQAASVAGPFGLFATQPDQLVDSPQLLPGETWKVSAPIHGVPPTLHLTATVAITPLLKTTPLRATPSTTTPPEVTPPGATPLGAAVLPATVSSTQVWAIPWTLLCVLGAFAAIATFLITRHRRRPRPAHAR